MKTLNQFITEALIHKIQKTKTTVKPKGKADLIKIIKDTIEKEGNECDLNFIDTSEIEDMSRLFYNNNLNDFNGNISDWDVSKVVNMSEMFTHSKFNGDISEWNVSKVENMGGMFYDSKFNGDISEWDVSNVYEMAGMFGRSKFNGDISEWNVSNVFSIYGMFANSKFDGDLSNWVLSNVTSTSDVFNMFGNSPLEKIYGETPKLINGKFTKKKI